ncbi:MAG: choice-of-anchor Q domain-containing protein [Candidatus Contendobacter sp.]|nr:choice-of-anchor Q domain-containing protein [Candidatus Contendobacter sp.]
MNDIVKTTDCILIDNDLPLSRQQRRALTRGQRKAEQKIGPSSGVVLALGAAFAGGHAQAATFTVTNLADAGLGSLRQAILDANGAAGADTITFQAGLTGTITLTTGQLAITDSVDIQGPGAAMITVSGNNASRVFYLYNGSATLDVTISGLTITGGNANIGAGIVDFDENLTLDNVTITGNTASGDGGGLWADGFSMNLTIRNSTISGNTSGDDGGGIYVEDTGGPLLIQNTVISGNQATGNGGGVYFYDPDDPVTIENSTISGNSAGGRGGGIYLYSPDSGAFTIRGTTISGNNAATGGGVYLYSPDHGGTIENSTISGNQATAGSGGGIVLYNLYNFEIRHTTIAGNSATGTGGGLFIEDGQLPLLNSLVGDNTAGANNDLGNGSGGSFDLTFTLVESPGTATINDNGGNIFGQDPQLGALANNGGPTQTHLPAGASPAVNAGDPAFAPPPSTDQRGLPRVVNGRIDMGAVEINPGTIQFSAPTYSVNENGVTATITATRTGGSDGGVSVDYATSDGTATQPADYASAVGTLNWANQDTANKTFSVTIVNDPSAEPNETVNLTLSNPQGGAALGTPGSAVLTIVDDDPTITQGTNAALTTPANTPGTVNLNATDPNPGDTLTWSILTPAGNGTATVSVTPTGAAQVITYTPNPNFVGPDSFVVQVSDGNGGVDTITVTVTVTAAAAGGPGERGIPTLGDYAKMLLGGLLAAAMAWVLPRRRRVNLLLLLPALALAITGGGVDSASAAQGEEHKHQNEKTGALARIEQTGERVVIVLADGTTVEIATDDVKVKDNDKSKAKSDRNQGLRVLQAAQAAGEPVTVKIEYDTAGTARKVKLIVGGQTP